MPQIDAITQYILAIVPAVTAIMGMVVVVGIGIGKIRKANQLTEKKVDEMSKRNSAYIEQNRELKKENLELKKAIVELNKKIDIIDVIKATRKE